MKQFNAKENDKKRKLLKFVESMFFDVPKSRIERAFRNKDIKINGKPQKDKNYLIRVGDVISVYGLETEQVRKTFNVTQKNFEVIFEDNNILIVDKHAWDVMSGDANSLDNQVLHHLKFRQKDSFVPASIGRLDRVTSGLVVYAKNYEALRELLAKQTHFTKKYIFKSDLKEDVTTTFKIMHDEERHREVCGEEGKDTKTIFTIEKGKQYATLLTGRKHQIRASLSKLGVPIWGDRKYGGKKADHVYLHSMSIKFEKLEGVLDYLNNQEYISLPKW